MYCAPHAWLIWWVPTRYGGEGVRFEKSGNRPVPVNEVRTTSMSAHSTPNVSHKVQLMAIVSRGTPDMTAPSASRANL